MKRAIQIILLLLIVFLGYRLVVSINEPVKFKTEMDKRYNKTVSRLKDIRTAQVAFKSKYERYTGNFDSLINFINKDSFVVIKQIGSEEDSVAVAKKMISREKIKISVKDSLFRNQNADSLRFVPFTGGRNQFELAAGVLETGSKVKIKVFECKVPFDILLKGLDRQLIVNINEEKKALDKYPGIMVGSLTEATNNAGNWE
ncbi:hypothetical protein [Williamwhitmania taraxaci]|uniref:Uncharacterized protein n=1 Tax=Williamwhitmania taraxaci TaxID=1640674 RepID=A0A1G6H6C8_9BACT|nr:hypothetical protein [Williamwhitmania taraxaci]SDB89713.1 hypothetical protein SAMN05216323_100761 [Williamwhitmania taraxaci]